MTGVTASSTAGSSSHHRDGWSIITPHSPASATSRTNNNFYTPKSTVSCLAPDDSPAQYGHNMRDRHAMESESEASTPTREKHLSTKRLTEVPSSTEHTAMDPVGCMCFRWRRSRLQRLFGSSSSKKNTLSAADQRRNGTDLLLDSDEEGGLKHPGHQYVAQGPQVGAIRSTSSSFYAFPNRRSSVSENSEFWDAVEIVDDFGDDSPQERDGGEEKTIRVELLKKTYDIVVKSTPGTIPVAFILTETLRRYAGFKVFKDTESQTAGLPGPSDGSNSLDVHRLIPSCKGLVNTRTGEVFGLMSQLTAEAMIGDTFAVVVDLTSTVDELVYDEDDLRVTVEGEDGVVVSPTETGTADGPAIGGLDKKNSSSSSISKLQAMKARTSSATSMKETRRRTTITSPSRGRAKAVFPATSVPRFPGASGDGSNSWSQPDATEFFVRGHTYMVDKIKVASQQAPYNLLGVDLLLTDTKRSCVCARPNSFFNRCKSNPKTSDTFIFAVNFSLPWGAFIAYFCPAHEGSSPYVGDPRLDSMLKRYLEGNDDFRNKRLKLIPRCVEGPWPVKAAVGTTPAIMGTKIMHTYYRQDNFFEIEVDIGSSVAAQYILSVVKSFTHIVSVDLAFVLQGEDESELPERILFAVRFHHLNVPKAPSFDEWESRP